MPTAKTYQKINMKLETLPTSSLPAHPARPSGRWRKPAAALVVLALAGGGWTVMHARSQPAADATPAQASTPAKAAAKPTVFELAGGDVAAIEEHALSVSLPLSGSLEPLSQATIKAKVSGQVESTTLQEGQSVGAGQVLVQLDPGDLRARVTQQQAALDDAQAKLSLAVKNANNNQALLKQNYISQNAYDSTQNSVEVARAAVKSAEAMVEIARIALGDTVIRAPIAGIVSKRLVQAGEKVAPDMAVYTIVNLAQLTLEAQVPASEIPRIKVGQDVSFKVDGYQQRDFHGKVARINPTTEAGSRAMLVYIAVANEDGALRGGMFAKGSIVTDRSRTAPIVPTAALRMEQGRQVVYQVENGKIVAQPVELGLRNDDEGYAEVTSGLGKGAYVIVSRLDSIKPGNLVKLPAAVTANKSAMLAEQDGAHVDH